MRLHPEGTPNEQEVAGAAASDPVAQGLELYCEGHVHATTQIGDTHHSPSGIRVASCEYRFREWMCARKS